MSGIMNSASKIVFVLLAVAAVVGLFLGKVTEANFMLLAIAAFSFYFGKKNPDANSDSTVSTETTTVTTPPAAE